MNANVQLTDAAIDAALARYAERISGDDLRDRIMADVAQTAQSRPRLFARPTWLAWPATSLRLVWVVAIAGLLLALLTGSLLVGSRIMESPPRPLGDLLLRHPAALVPTGLETPAPGRSAFGTFPSAVADSTGAVWTRAGRTLGRIDPSGAVRTWTFADDAAFGNIGVVVPAHGGGVWLVPPLESGDQALLRWFDGERFRDVVPAPPGGAGELAEAPDGSLWSGAEIGLFHWDGTSWSAAQEGRPVAGVASLAVDRSGAVWVGNCDYDWAGACSEHGISRLDGTRWETFPDVALPNSIVEAPDGSIWVAGGGHLARFDGHAWTRVGGDPPLNPAGIAVAADGTAWVTSCAYLPYGAEIARYDGSAWVKYTRGLPPGSYCGQPAATADGVYLGVDDGLYRLVGEDWELVWPQP